MECTLTQWKQFIEGLARKRFGPFVQQNIVAKEDCVRGYWDGNNLVASMTVLGSNSDKHALECERIFYVEEYLLKQCADIRILTQEEWDEWDEGVEDDETWLREHGEIE